MQVKSPWALECGLIAHVKQLLSTTTSREAHARQEKQSNLPDTELETGAEPISHFPKQDVKQDVPLRVQPLAIARGHPSRLAARPAERASQVRPRPSSSTTGSWPCSQGVLPM